MQQGQSGRGSMPTSVQTPIPPPASPPITSTSSCPPQPNPTVATVIFEKQAVQDMLASPPKALQSLPMELEGAFGTLRNHHLPKAMAKPKGTFAVATRMSRSRQTLP